jgi:hypothetical protein
VHNPTIKTCLVAPRILVVSILLFSDATVLRAAPAGFDPVAETERLLASGPAGPWAQSDAYSEGGCWLQLWGPLVTCLIARLLYRTGWATGLRNLAELPVLIAGFVLFLLLATPLNQHDQPHRGGRVGRTDILRRGADSGILRSRLCRRLQAS